MFKRLGFVTLILSCFLLMFSACKKTEGCTDSQASNSGDFDKSCDNCCTYDADKFYNSYLGDLRFTLLPILNADSVTFEIIQLDYQTKDSVGIRIVSDMELITSGARVEGDSLFIKTVVAEFETPIGPISDVDIDGGGELRQDSLVASMKMIAVFNGEEFIDDMVFKGVRTQ